MDILRPLIHYSLHFLAPAFIAKKLRPDTWKKGYLILLATNLVDLDHLFADPIFDPNRLSLGFHYLHSYPAIAVYALMLFHQKTRFVAFGLLLHMGTDGLDYLLLQFIN